MKTFFQNFKRSLSDASFYKEIAAGTHPLKVRYAFGLSLILSIIISSILAITLYTVLVPEAKKFVSEKIPSDLVVTLKSGQLSINQPSPYVFPFALEDQTSTVENALVIDTESTSTLETFSAYKTAILAGKNTLISQKESGEIKVIPLNDFPNFTLTQDSATRAVDKAVSWLWILPVLALIPITLFQFLALMIVFLIAALILWIIFKVSSREITFAQAFTASMYAYTAVFILDVVLFTFNLYNMGVFLSAFLTALIATAFLFSKPTVTPVVVTETDPAPVM